MLFAVIAAATTPLLAWAQTVGQGAAAAMPASMLVGVQGALTQAAGARLIASDPALTALMRMDPSSALQLKALAGLSRALTRDRDFETNPGSPAARQLAASAILRAVHSAASRSAIERVLQDRLDELHAASKAGTLDARAEASATAELAPLALAARDLEAKDMNRTLKTAQALANALETAPSREDIQWIPTLSLGHMLQPDVGMLRVAKKAAKLRAMKPVEQTAYLISHAAPVIVRKETARQPKKGSHGPMEMLPTDHHHLARAAWELGIAKIAIEVQEMVKGKMSDKKFWKWMTRRKQVYLFDRFGNPISPDDLPVDVRGLGDDPYRSVAGEVQDLGGFKKTRESFAEFRWASFFREHLGTHPNRDFDGAVKEALALARSPEAKGLPGYIGKK